MTADELEQAARDLIDEISMMAPGARHSDLDRLHGVMADYARSGRATPPALRRLLEELTAEAIERGLMRLSA